MPLSLPRRKPANRQAPLKRHLPRPRERHPVHGAVVGHITDLETIVCRRVNGPTRVQTKRRHRSTVSVADRANPGSDAQRSPGQCNVGCNLHSDSAAFTWTGQLLSRPIEDCEGCPRGAGVRNLSLDGHRPSRPDLHCNFGGVPLGGGVVEEIPDRCRGVPYRRARPAHREQHTPSLASQAGRLVCGF
jgi:hypothetical protein